MSGILSEVVAFFMCVSADERAIREKQISAHIESLGNVYCPWLSTERFSVDGLVGEPAPGAGTHAVKAGFFPLDERSPIGFLALSSRIGRGNLEAVDFCKRLGIDLLGQGFVDSVLINRDPECKKKSIFSGGYESSLVASPDFAKLTLLHYLSGVDAHDLVRFVGGNPRVESATYCRCEWNALLKEAKKKYEF